MTETKPQEVIRRFERLRTNRSEYENSWQEIRELVLPHHADFQRKYPVGDVRSTRIYDATAVDAADELANEITTNTTSATDRWFSLEITNSLELNNDPEVMEWLEFVADAIYSQYSNPGSKFYPTIYEVNAELVGFGTGVINQEWHDGHLLFRAIPLSEAYLDQNSKNEIDTVYRCLEYDTRQLKQEFGMNLPKEILEDVKEERSWEVIHAVMPRDNYNGGYSSERKPFKSCWVVKCKEPAVLRESGYDSLPYHVSRWTTLAGEVYGRGPAIKCLPDIRMLNRMEYTMIKAGQKQVDPPLFVPSDNFIAPIKTAPGSINFMENPDAPPQVLDNKGNLAWGEDKCEQKRVAIRKAFYGDWVKWNQKTERQSAYEISELVDQQLRKMGGIVGRLQGETHGPLLERSYELMAARRLFPPPPAQIQGKEFRVVYVSPAARAQLGTKLVAMNRFLQNLVPAAQVKPEVMDIVNVTGWGEATARYTGVPRGVINTPAEIQRIAEERAQQQQLQSIAENAQPVAAAVKDLSEAQAAGNIAI